MPRTSDSAGRSVQTEPSAPALVDVRRHVEALCSIGNRYVGSPGESQARDYILQHFRECGLANVRAEQFAVRTYRAGPSTCAVPDWDLSLDCAGLQATIAGEVRGSAVFLGRALSAADLRLTETRLPPLAGKIAVVQSYWPWELTEHLIDRGVVGIVLIGEVPDDLIAQLPAGWYGSPASELVQVPGVIIGAQTGARLLTALASGTSLVHLAHACDYESTLTANLLGELPAPDATEQVVVAAHYDTFMSGVGAHDNATGLGALLGLITVWQERQFRRKVVFASFAAEELGLCGAAEYCRRHRGKLPSTAAMVNFDALAWSAPGQRCLVVHPVLERFAVDALSDIGWVPDLVWDAREAASDVRPFVDAGVPAAWCWRFPPQHAYFASDGDRPELLDFELVAQTAAAGAHLAGRLASDQNTLPPGG